MQSLIAGDYDDTADRPKRQESPPSMGNGMVSEKVDVAMPMRNPAVEQPKWERGRDVAEMEVSILFEPSVEDINR